MAEFLTGLDGEPVDGGLPADDNLRCAACPCGRAFGGISELV